MTVMEVPVRPVLSVVDGLSPCVRNAMACYVAELELAVPDLDASPCADLAADPGSTMLLGTLDDHPVALGAVQVEGVGARITHLWVRPAWRRGGWASHLLSELENVAASRGARRIEAHAHGELVAAHQLFLRSGYRGVGPWSGRAGPIGYVRDLTVEA